MNVSEAADAAGVTPTYIRILIAREHKASLTGLKATKRKNGQYEIEERDLERWMEQRIKPIEVIKRHKVA